MIFLIKKQQIVLPRITITYGFLTGKYSGVAERCQHGVVERHCARQISDGNRKMVQHATLLA